MKRRLYYLYVEYPLRVHLVSYKKKLDISFTPYRDCNIPSSTFPYPGSIDQLFQQNIQQQFDIIEILVCEDNMAYYLDENGCKHSISNGWINLKEYIDRNF